MPFISAGQLLRSNEGSATPVVDNIAAQRSQIRAHASERGSVGSSQRVAQSSSRHTDTVEHQPARGARQRRASSGGLQQTLSFKKAEKRGSLSSGSNNDLDVSSPAKRICIDLENDSVEPVELLSSLVGRRFHSDGAALLLEHAKERATAEGRVQVTLEREPNNRHDALALLIRFPSGSDGSPCGHVPREHAQALSPLIDSNKIVVSGALSVKSLLDAAAAAPVDLYINVEILPGYECVHESLRRLKDQSISPSVAASARPLRPPRKKNEIDVSRRSQGLQRSLLCNFGMGTQGKDLISEKSCPSLLAVIGAACLFPDVASQMSVRSVMLLRVSSSEWRHMVDQLRFMKYRVAVESFIHGFRCPVDLVPSPCQLQANNYLDHVLNEVKTWATRQLSFETVMEAISSVFPTKLMNCIAEAFQNGGVTLDGWQALALGIWLAPSEKRLTLARVALRQSDVHMDEFRELVALLVVIAQQLLSSRPRSFGSSRLYADLLACNRLLEDAGIKLPLCGLHMPGVRLTEEQSAIVMKDLKPSEQMRITAFAGTGKTSTLRMYASLRPHLRFLYICFNVSVREEAQRSFPGHVICKNAHQLAYASCGFKFKHKLKDDLRIEDLVSHPLFDEHSSLIGECKENLRMEIVEACLAVLSNFINSSSDGVGIEHMPSPLPLVVRDGHLSAESVCAAAKRLWQDMCDIKSELVRMTHNGYLKLYSLSNPCLSKQYNMVLLDEAQDCNPAIARIVVSQNCARILVGDGHQSIYGFLGAMDVLNSKPHSGCADSGCSSVIRRQLTRSFRFGPNIADIANCLLRNFKGETRPLLGCGKHAGIVKPNTPDTLQLGTRGLQGCPAIPFAFVARTNASVVEMALRADEAGLSLAWTGGIRGYNLNVLRDLCLLALGCKNEIENSRIRKFNSLDAFRQFTRRINDGDALARIDLVRRHNPQDLLDRLRHLQSAADLSEKNGTSSIHKDISLATVHKAKGLEWDSVMLADDFSDPRDFLKPGMSQEVNALYVAVTRAVRELQPPQSLFSFYKSVAESLTLMFIDPFSESINQPCPNCGAPPPFDWRRLSERQTFCGSQVAKITKVRSRDSFACFVGHITHSSLCDACHDAQLSNGQEFLDLT